MESIHEYRVEAIGAGGRNGAFMPKESCRPYRLARRLNFKVRSAGGLQNISWLPPWPAASSALLKEWHRPRVWNLILCDWPRKVCSPNRTAVGALQRFDCGPPSPSGKKEIMTGPFACLRRPRNRASSHGLFSAKSLSSRLSRSRKNCPCR